MFRASDGTNKTNGDLKSKVGVNKTGIAAAASSRSLSIHISIPPLPGIASSSSTSTVTSVKAAAAGIAGNPGNTSASSVGTMSKDPSPSGLPQKPLVLCGDGKNGCLLPGSPVFPCHRCHKEFFCSDKHRKHSKDRHDVQDCTTKSKVHFPSGDKEYQMRLQQAFSTTYDMYLNYPLLWSSLTVQWMPHHQKLGGGIESYEVLIGTYTTGDTNHLLVCGIDVKENHGTYKSGIPQFVRCTGDLKVKKRIVHQGEIHRARYMPQSPHIIATKSPSSDVYLFDLDKYKEVPENDEFKPRLRLTGHTADGFALAWNPGDPGVLLSGSNDQVVCLWDINHLNKDEKSLSPVTVFRHHTGNVEDVEWHPGNSRIAISVGFDKKIVLWDTRVGTGSESRDDSVYSNETGHTDGIYCVNFSPFNENSFITGSSDKTVAVWDLRNFTNKVHSFETHRDEVMQVQWSPHFENMFASASKDKRVFVWNLNKLDNPKEPTSRSTSRFILNSKGSISPVDPPPELYFIHGGHISAINDFSWHPEEPGLLASVCDKNSLQVWQISEDVLYGSEASDSDEEMEG